MGSSEKLVSVFLESQNLSLFPLRDPDILISILRRGSDIPPFRFLYKVGRDSNPF